MTTRRPRTQAVADVVAAGSLVVLGLVYGALAVGEGIGTMAETGAGFFPLVVAVVLVAASVVLLVQGLRGMSRGEVAVGDGTRDRTPDGTADGDTAGGAAGAEDDEVRWPRVAGVLAVALLVPAVGATVGMIVTLSVTVALAAKIMGVVRWSRAVVLGVAFGAVTWLVFVRLLYVPLPAGTLGLV